MSKRNEHYVPKSVWPSFWEFNSECFLVNCLIDKLIDYTLRNTLWLSHHFLLEEDLLPIKLHLSSMVKHFITIIDFFLLTLFSFCFLVRFFSTLALSCNCNSLEWIIHISWFIVSTMNFDVLLVVFTILKLNLWLILGHNHAIVLTSKRVWTKVILIIFFFTLASFS